MPKDITASIHKAAQSSLDWNLNTTHELGVEVALRFQGINVTFDLEAGEGTMLLAKRFKPLALISARIPWAIVCQNKPYLATFLRQRQLEIEFFRDFEERYLTGDRKYISECVPGYIELEERGFEYFNVLDLSYFWV